MAVVLAVLALGRAGTESWLAAQPGYHWSFPADHWSHPGYKTEWWYFTGHLATSASAAESSGSPPVPLPRSQERRFGYQFTFFRIGILPERPRVDSAWAANNVIMGHASITDVTGKEHRFSEVLYREIPLLGALGTVGDDPLAWSTGPPGTADRWTLQWNGQGFDLAMHDSAQAMAFRLSTRAVKPLVLQGPDGYSRKGTDPAAASLYYSFTRLATSGTLTLAGQTCQVTGWSWMDREFGSNQLSENQVGWDWFSLQLDDGREIMLYILRDRDGRTDFARGTLVDRSGAPRYLEPNDWRLGVTAHWRSGRTAAEYPSRWLLEVPSAELRLEIVPLVADQENVSRLSGDLVYWEGAVEILGPGRQGDQSWAPRGKGYVELTGYGPGNRPPI